MDVLTEHTPMTRLLSDRGAFDRHPFVLIDVGCAGGIDGAWRAFGPSLVAHAYDPDVAACEDAQAQEPFEGVRYHARHVGLPDSHPFVQRRREDAARWPNTNIWDRITAGYLAARVEKVPPATPLTPPAASDPPPAAPRRMADPSDVIGVGDIVRIEGLSTVDFLKIDVDGPDLEVLESARETLTTSRVLGVGMEVNWFGSANPTEHTFHHTDRLLREEGFTLFGLTVRRYSRTDLPAPFEREAFAYTRFGQPYQGDAIYLRDLAAGHLAAIAAEYPTEKLIKLACLYELARLPDCAAEVLNHFERRLWEVEDRQALLDALTPPLLGEQLSYRRYTARFEREPELFLPSAGSAPTAEAGAPGSGAAVTRSVSDRIKGRIVWQYATMRSHYATVRSLRGRRRVIREDQEEGLAARLRSDFLHRAPNGLIHSVAEGLAHARPLGLDPGWQQRLPGDDEGQLTLLRRDIWAHYREHRIDRPIDFRWYERLRIRLYLGNDLSLCLYVLGAFEPNEFVFLRSALEPGMVVLDGGANEGLFSLYAARRVGSSGAVLAVEPSTREFERLEANVALNRLDNVRAFKLALGSRVGEARLAVARSRHAGMNAIDAGDPGGGLADWAASRETVDLETIDELVARSGLERLDLVKLDVEGSEVDALDGARATIERFQPTILLEAEEARLASQGRSKQDLVQALGELGYELWAFDAGSAQLRRANLPLEPAGNAIAAPPGWCPPVLG
jgi:FkbM family methyltransferase